MEPPGKPAPEGDKNTPLSQAVSASGESLCIVLQAIPTAGRGARLPFDVREYCHYIVYSWICQHHILWKMGGKPKWRTWRNAVPARLACVLHALPTTLSTDNLFSPRTLHTQPHVFPSPLRWKESAVLTGEKWNLLGYLSSDTSFLPRVSHIPPRFLSACPKGLSRFPTFPQNWNRSKDVEGCTDGNARVTELLNSILWLLHFSFSPASAFAYSPAKIALHEFHTRFPSVIHIYDHDIPHCFPHGFATPRSTGKSVVFPFRICYDTSVGRDWA